MNRSRASFLFLCLGFFFLSATTILAQTCGSSSYRSFDQAALPTADSLTGRLKQTLVSEDGRTAYYRYGYWNQNTSLEGRQGVYTNWTAWSTLDLTTLQVPGVTEFRSFTHTMLPNNPAVIKQTLVSTDGRNAYYRYGTWDTKVSDFRSWTEWATLNLGTLGAGPSSFQFMDQAALPTKNSPTERMKQTLVSEDGRTAYYRYGYWDTNTNLDGRQGVYTNWTSWSTMDLSTLQVPGVTTFRSFTHTMLPNNPAVIKQTLVTMDGKTAYYRYGTWDAAAGEFKTWTTPWASMSLTELVATCADPSDTCKKSSGDANCDGAINESDYTIWKDEFISGSGNSADFNSDSKVDLVDFEIWRRNKKP